MNRRVKGYILAALLGAMVAVPVLGFVAPAQAHNYLVASTPAEGSTLTALPAAFTITTNDNLLDLSSDNAGFAFRIQDAAGLYYGDGCVTVKGPTMTTAAALGTAGQYTVTWQVVSTDGHSVSDRYSFTWAPAPGAVLSTGTASVRGCGGASAGSAPSSGPAASADDGTLSTVLWIGGAVLAVGIAVVITVLLTTRKRA